MDEFNFELPNVSKEQLNKYKGTTYDNDTLNIGRTEVARYLSGDKHLLTKEQMDYINGLNIPTFKKGSGIHIKKENRGKFTDYCNGKVTQECIDKAKRSGNKKLVKRAVFAENARKWTKKHLTGGLVNQDVDPEVKAFIERMMNAKTQSKSWTELNNNNELFNQHNLQTTEQGDSVWSGNIGDKTFYVAKNGVTGKYMYNNTNENNNLQESENVQLENIPANIRNFMNDVNKTFNNTSKPVSLINVPGFK